MKFDKNGERLDIWISGDEHGKLAVERFIQSREVDELSDEERFPLPGVFVASVSSEPLLEPKAILSKEGLRIIVSQATLPAVIPGYKVERQDGAEGLTEGVTFHLEQYRSDLPA